MEKQSRQIPRKAGARLLALLLTLTMAFSLTPLAALAEEEPTPSESDSPDSLIALEADAGETPPPEETPPEDDLTAGLIPFEDIAEGAAFSAYASAIGGPDYFAFAGDFAVRVDTGNYGLLPENEWIDVTLSPLPDGDDLTKKLYTEVYGYGGALFLDGAPSGTYALTYDDGGGGGMSAMSVQPLGTLEIAPQGTQRAIALGGTRLNSGATSLSSYSGGALRYGWLSQLFDDERGYLSYTYGMAEDYYYTHADGSVWLTLVAANIKPGDITSVTVNGSGTNVLASVIPDGGFQYYLKLSASAALTGADTFAVTINGIEEPVSVSLQKSSNANYFLGASDIDDLKLYIVPVNVNSPPHTLYVKIFDRYYSSGGAQLLQGTTPVALEGGRYTLDLTSNVFLFDSGQYPYVCLYESEGSNNPTQTVYLSSYRILQTGVPTTPDGYGYDFSSIDASELLSAVNGQNFIVSQYPGSGASYRAGVVFSLADASFNLVSGVTIAKDESRSTPSQDSYKFEAAQPLIVGETYYLMLGGFPLKKLTAVSVFGDTGNSNQIYFGGYTYDNASGIYSGDKFSFTIYTPGSTITPGEWSVELKNVLTEAVTTHSVSGGTLQQTDIWNDAQHVQLATSTAPAAGIYLVEYYRGGEKVVQNQDNPGANEFRYVSPTMLIVEPSSRPALFVQGVGTTRIYETGDNAFFINGYTPTQGVAVPALTVSFYPITPPTVGAAAITKTFPAMTSWEDGYFWQTFTPSVLSAAGLTPGFYYVVITQPDGSVLYANSNITLTETFFADPNAVTLSGTVSLRGTAAPALTVELWQGASKVADTTTSGGTFRFAGLAKGSAYTLKIPAPTGTSWEAYTHPAVMLTGSQAVSITLVSAVPSYVVSGVVRAGDPAAPVQNVTVRTYAKTDGTQAAAATTDAQGQYTLNLIDGTYVLKVLATADYKEYVSAEFTVSGAAITDKDIALELKPYIEGTALLGGEPTSGVYVYLYSGDSYVKSATTGEDGKFIFKNLAESASYRLRVIGGNNYAADDVSVTTGTSGKTEGNVTLIPLVTVSGIVTLPDSPVAGVYVYLYTEGNYVGSARTDDVGAYSITNVRGDDATTYKLKLYATADYAAYESAGFTLSANAAKDITLAAIPKYAAAFTVNTVAAEESFALYVYGGNTPTTEVVDEEGVYSIQLPTGSYTYYYFYEGIYGSGNFTVPDSAASVVIALPTLYTVSGVVKAAEVAVSGAAVNVSGSFSGSTVTDATGEYSFKTTKSSGNITVTARHDTAGYGSSASVALGTNPVSVPDITLAVNSVTVTVKNVAGSPISDVYIHFGSHYNYTYDSGEYIFRNVGAGNFSYYASKYGYLSVGGTKDVAATGDTELEITLPEDLNLVYAFSLGMSSDEISSGGYVVVHPELKYTGSGTPVTGGTVTLTLPAGVSVGGGATNPYANGGYTVTFDGDKTVKLPSVRVTVDNSVDNLSDLSIRAVFSATNISKYAYNSLTVVNATINAPGVVEEDTAFTVYGTAPTGSVVAIKAGDTTLKTATVQNRYYKVSVTIEAAGEYGLQAVAAVGDQTFYSPVSALTVTAEPAPTITNVGFTGGYLSTPVNSAYGVKTFSTWVLSRYSAPYAGQYRGIYDITGSFTVTDLGSYAVKSVRFTDAVTGIPALNNVTPTLTNSGGASYSFNFQIDTWGGLGVEPITVVLEKDGNDYTFTIALVTILIDPSGYVYDAVTDERITDATVTLETKPTGGDWSVWEDPDGLQANPQTTDAEGKYGWMVPKGEYRVLVSKTGYADAIANNFDDGTKIADGGYDADSNAGFPVPPEQTEVNIPLKYTGTPTVSASWDAANKAVVVKFSRPMPVAATKANISVKIGDAEPEGAWTVTDGDKTFTFKPSTAPDVNSVVKVAIDASALSGDGVAIGGVTIPDVTVTAEQNDSDSGSIGSGGAASSDASKTAPAADGSVLVSYTQTDGAVTLELPDGKVNEIIAHSDGEAMIDLTGAANATSAALPKTAVAKLADAGLAVEIIFPQGAIALEAVAAASIAEQAAGADVTIGVKPVAASSLNAAQKAAVGGAPVFDISITSGSSAITSLGGGKATVSLPYTLKAGEKASGVVVLYVDGDGKTEEQPMTYSSAAKKATFTTTHLSLYAITYDESLAGEPWTNPFIDVRETDWFYSDVEYAYVNGLMNGVSATVFDPNGTITRAMVVTILYRAADAEWGDADAPFDDVLPGKWYTDAVAWAAANGIVNGVGDNKFAPDEPVTREQFATILYRYYEWASALDGVRQDAAPTDGGANLAVYADAGDISDWASEAVKWAVGQGVITGKPGGLIDPQGTATRAESAAMLRRYIENVG
jgi:hypothetical protein